MHILTSILLLVACAAAVPAAVDAFHAGSPSDVRAVLRDVERGQAEHHAAHGRYSASLRGLGVRRPPGVDVRITVAGAAGYSAVALGPREECAVFHGGAPPPRAYARTAGRIACRPRCGALGAVRRRALPSASTRVPSLARGARCSDS